MVFKTGEVAAPDFTGPEVAIIDFVGEVEMDSFDFLG